MNIAWLAHICGALPALTGPTVPFYSAAVYGGLPMNKKPLDKPVSKSTPAPAAAAPGGLKKKKLSLDVSDVSEVLERKISP